MAVQSAALMAMMTALAAGAADGVDVGEIMAKVGANQQAAREARRNYVYRQEQVIRMRRSNNRIAREERFQFEVMPTRDGTKKHLAKFDGKYEVRGKLVSYEQPGRMAKKDLDLDGDLIQDMSKDMMNDDGTHDGIGHDMFPLTTEEQKKYDFRLLGTEEYRGRRVYQVAFRPRKNGEASWKGTALIDAEEFQPVMVETSLAEKIPTFVKVFFGTDVKGLGFSVAFQKFDGGVWFPVSYGGEFEVRGLFFYKRKISVSMVNSDFRKTDVKSTVTYGTDAH